MKGYLRIVECSYRNGNKSKEDKFLCSEGLLKNVIKASNIYEGMRNKFYVTGKPFKLLETYEWLDTHTKELDVVSDVVDGHGTGEHLRDELTSEDVPYKFIETTPQMRSMLLKPIFRAPKKKWKNTYPRRLWGWKCIENSIIYAICLKKELAKVLPICIKASKRAEHTNLN